MTSRAMHFDIVSDVVCPWCVIGLAQLERALAATADVLTAEIVFHPLQLNPGLPPEGEPVAENISRKYGVTPDEARQRGGGVRAAAAEAGVAMAGRPDRLYDTFDAHRLLHWAGIVGNQRALKHALLDAYFERGENVSSHDVLLAAVERAGLSRETAGQVLSSGAFGAEVIEDENRWRGEGIGSVPTIVIDGEFVIAGAQTADRLERALRKLAAR